MPRPYISPPSSRRSTVVLQYITIYLDRTLYGGTGILGPIEGDRLMKSATRGWNNAERNPMILRRHDRTAEAASSEVFLAEFAMVTVGPVSMNSRGARAGGPMPPALSKCRKTRRTRQSRSRTRTRRLLSRSLYRKPRSRV